MTDVVIIYHVAESLANHIAHELQSRGICASAKSIFSIWRYARCKTRFRVVYLLEDTWNARSNNKTTQTLAFLEHCNSICDVLLPSFDLTCIIRSKAYVEQLKCFMLPRTMFCANEDDLDNIISYFDNGIVRLKPGYGGEGKGQVCLRSNRKCKLKHAMQNMLHKAGSLVVQPNVDGGMWEIKMPVLHHELCYSEYMQNVNDDDVLRAIDVAVRFALPVKRAVEDLFDMPLAYRIDICVVENNDGSIEPYLQEIEIVGGLIHTYEMCNNKISFDVSPAISDEIQGHV